MTEVINITDDIVGQRTINGADNSDKLQGESVTSTLDKNIDRPSSLPGVTYKIKSPLEEDSLYVTINDILIDSESESPYWRPYEIFINSKNTTHQQWITALTRLISRDLRERTDYHAVVSDLKSITDPNGGFRLGSTWVPSIVALIGITLETHFKDIALRNTGGIELTTAYAETKYPEGGGLCSVCNEYAVFQMDGCDTCLSCGDSKCG